MCEQLAQGRYLTAARPGVEFATSLICNEAVPFRPFCVGVATRTRNVSEYMLVLALCLVELRYIRMTSIIV